MFKKTVLQLCLVSTLLAAIPSSWAIAPSDQVKHLNIGDLPVKTIVSITAKTAVQTMLQAERIAAHPDADIAEFHIDLLDFATDTAKVIVLGHQLNQILKDKPLIATIRTDNEGGQMRISDQDDEKIYHAYLKQPFMQLLDIEMFRNAKRVADLTQLTHQQHILVMMSNHDLNQTPDQQQIEQRLLQQDRMGADILKIAVMPTSKQDVITLMNAIQMVSQKSSKPLLTISMGQLGTLSRIATANMGGSLSFGMIGDASAPGQIDVKQLKQFLKTVQPAF